jgi:hypothetical protein
MDQEKLVQQLQYREQLSHEIGDIALSTIQKLAPSLPDPPSDAELENSKCTVQQYLYPAHVKLQLVTFNGCLDVIEGHHSKIQDHIEPIALSELGDIKPALSLLPAFSASQVYISTSRYRTGFSAFSAFIHGEQFVCKIVSNFFRSAIVSELGVLVEIQTANLDPEVRTSRLKGKFLPIVLNLLILINML